MANILIVGQKELVANPIFKQDQNMSYIYNSLKDDNNVSILYVHKDVKVNDKTKKEETKTDIKKVSSDVKQFCIRDMIKNRMLKKNINSFIQENKIETIIFMSSYMAKLIMPYIEDKIENLNVICDFRLTNISCFLQQYQYEKENEVPNFHRLYKDFKMHFIQMLPILQYTDAIILDEDSGDQYLLKAQKITNNIILPEQVKGFVKQKKSVKNNKKEDSFVEMVISRNNYSSKIESKSNIQSTETINRYVINETNKFNLIDDINSIIKKSSAEYVVIYNDRIKILPNTLNLLIKFLSFSDNHALCSPVVCFSRERNTLQTTFDNQRFNNFSNWNESNPLFFSECVVIKKKFFNKVGLFDNSFKTLDYALFDFILRIYQIKAYYCVMNDISVFKPMNISRQISLYKEDKIFLCNKWGESSFDMEI
ncbi:MAG: hypothetical protein J6U02_02635 [Elusimicrobia bacterium]|nr:hypothetical protein [Elusimicrobiota bacterium]